MSESEELDSVSEPDEDQDLNSEDSASQPA